MPHCTRILRQPITTSITNQMSRFKVRLQTQPQRCFNTSQSTSPYEDLFRYTSGRWLWGEESNLRERYVSFNIHELKCIATQSFAAKSCVSITKLAEVGCSKVFRLVMDNGYTAIARIPHPNAGPAFKTTASELATMDFVRPNPFNSIKVSTNTILFQG
jgi:hypothetical protein